MAEHVPPQAGPETVLPTSRTEASSLHIASGADAREVAARDDHLDEILTRGDIRDQAAERRDRHAERRPLDGDVEARLDRTWAGRDRDAAAVDRADLVLLLHAQEHDPRRPVFVEQV